MNDHHSTRLFSAAAASRAEGRAARGFARADAPAAYAPDLGIEPVHMDVTVQLNERAPELWVTVEHQLRVRRAGVRALRLDAVDLEEVEVEALEGPAVRALVDRDAVSLTWEAAAEVGATLRVRLRYRVASPLTGVLFSLASADDPTRPVFVATDHETERARHWLACVDHPNVRTTLSLRLRGPSHWTLLANGALLSDAREADGTHTCHWQLAQPCPSYLICFLAGELVRADDGDVNGTAIAYFAPPPMIDEDLWRSFGRTGALLRWITEKLGRPYPYPKYYQFAVPSIGGAMENISLVSWDDAWVADKRLHAEIGWLVDLVNLHEMAHTWFGDRVVCRDFAHSWLKEGWATYMESVWLGDVEGPDAAQVQMFDERRLYVEEAEGRYQRPIVTRHFDSSWDLFDAHLYPGAAWRVHMLRRRIGEAPFWAGVRAYLDAFEDKVVETDDLRRTLEAHSGLSLARFFDQWLYQPGYPKLKAEWTWDGDRAEGRLRVKQTQVNADLGIGLFDLDLPIAIQRSCGRWERFSLRLHEAQATLRVPANHEPLQILIDPDGDVLQVTTFDPGPARLARTLREGPSAWSRMEAAMALGRSGRPQALRAIAEAWPAEPHWGVRKVFAAALGAAGTLEAARQILSLLWTEQDPRVVGSLAEAAGKVRHPSVVTGLMGWISGGAQPYRATAAALVSLGRQRDPDTEALLLAVSHDAGWWGWVQRGAMQALGELRSPASVLRLQQATESPTVRRPARLAAAEALGAAARWQDRPAREQAREHLERLTLDPDYGMRMAACRGLSALGDPAARPAMQRSLRALAAQDRPKLQRLIDGLSEAAPGERAAKLQETVEGLQDKLRALEDRLAALEPAGR